MIVSIFADNGDFYPGYPGYGEYFPDGQGGPGGVNFLPPSGPPGSMGEQIHPGKALRQGHSLKVTA